MKRVFVLGPLNKESAWQLQTLNADCIYHFSNNDFSPSSFSEHCYCLPSPQLNAKIEFMIIDACIERNIKSITDSDDQELLMKRGLRLSELRIEAKCFLNAIDFINKNMTTTEKGTESIIFVSHYLSPSDVTQYAEFNIDWHLVTNFRFIGFIPGFRWLVYFFRSVITSKFYKRHN